MALALSSTKSSTYEPLRKNRWVMQFTDVSNATGEAEDLAFAAHTANRPSLAYTSIETARLNERFYVAGKPTWTEISMSFYDFISTTAGQSVSDILWEWSKSVYDPVTGAMGFKSTYSTSGTLAMLDPSGGVVQVWNLFKIWPMSVTWGDLSADDDGIAEVAAVFRYDYAVKGIDTASTT